MGKRKQREHDDDGPVRSSEPASIGQLTSHIANKQRRSEEYGKLKHKKEKAKRAERKKRQAVAAKAEELGLEAPPRKITKTIENTREKDETVVAADDAEVQADEAQDEFAEHFQRLRPPNVLLTTCYKPSGIMYKFLAELLEVLPCATYYKRQGYALKKICEYATNRDYTDVIVLNEDRKSVNGLLLIHLPGGPTAHFKLSSLKLSKDIQHHGRASSHRPELILNNFGTRLGHRLGRMFASIFSQDPNFKGRRAVTFHNQRDYIFFSHSTERISLPIIVFKRLDSRCYSCRHHRYIFEAAERRGPGETEKSKRVIARLQELGPRFTLKLLSLQKGTFDSKGGEYEWVHNHKTMDTSRRRFFL